ncbi:polymer-forming cytoskeletal protein [Methanolobus psychrotolerans]|uniref:polymer-forming cytoskeletal protein n=1 Tax=Methanolobus psychrotolerans TaxID=1874706 RepID=UPI0013ECC6FF|nr:polymer-forming cytoskeletal protein [Methanolobus psychrotolerans]
MELILIIFILSYPASAFTIIEGKDTIIIDNEIHDDIYVAGNNIIIIGTVYGDVVAAGGTVDIRGNITQDLIVAAGDVIITGNIGDDVRVASGKLTISGDVHDDLVLFAGDTIISSTGAVGGDLTSMSSKLNILGDVNGNVTGSGGEVTFGGMVGGNVDLTTEKLVLLPDAHINGNFKYQSPASIHVPAGTVGKEVQFLEKQYYTERNSSFSFMWWFIGYLSLVLIGLLAMSIWPEQISNIASKTPESPGKSFLIGLAIFIASGIIASFLLITLIGIPLSMILIALILLGLYTARIFTALWLGKYLFTKIDKKPKTWIYLVFGIFVLLLVGEIPVIGSLVYIVATFIPIGNIYYAVRE